MNNPLVSIIVPVYNCEKYLFKCTNNLLLQTYKNIQIILVDDGSTDLSADICRAFNDDRIVFLQKKNGGASSARNYGLKHAKGDYILFVDSDDYLEESAVETLISIAFENDSDVVYFEADNFAEDASIEIKEKGFSQKHQYSITGGNELIPILIKNKDYHAAPFLFFIKSTVFDSGLSFKEGIMMEDELFSFQLFRLCNKVLCLKKELYHRRVRPGSVMTSTGKEEFRYVSIRTVFTEVAKEFNHDTEDNTLKIYLARIAMLVIGYFSAMPKELQKKYKFEYREMKRFIRAEKGFGMKELVFRTYGKFAWFIYAAPDRLLKKLKNVHA